MADALGRRGLIEIRMKDFGSKVYANWLEMERG